MWLKVCGLTRCSDALLARYLGADALGFILTESPRRADPLELKKWLPGMRDIEKVGVFRSESPETIRELAEMLGLTTVQIHGPLTPGHLELGRDYRLIKAVKDAAEGKLFIKSFPSDSPSKILIDRDQSSEVFEEGCGEELFSKSSSPLDLRILLDPSQGTGRQAAWCALDYDYILAGGLNPANVRQAIAQARPAGVDVSSGVEAAPGIKDHDKLEDFIREVRS